VIVDAGLELAVQGVGGGLVKREAVDVFQRPFDAAYVVIRDEQIALVAELVTVALEPLVCLEARTRGAAQRAAEGLFFVRDDMCQALLVSAWCASVRGKAFGLRRRRQQLSGW
jgi:hypothetical protein